MKPFNNCSATFAFIFFISFGLFSQTEKRDSILLLYNGKSFIKPFETIDRVDSLFNSYKQTWGVPFPIQQTHFGDTSKFQYNVFRYPFDSPQYYNFNNGTDYFLIGELILISGKETRKVHAIWGSWNLITKYDSLINTTDYACELIKRVANGPLLSLRDLYRCEDLRSYEFQNNDFFEKIVFEPPVQDDFPMEMLYYVSYYVEFK
jgi:hypothetical protein